MTSDPKQLPLAPDYIGKAAAVSKKASKERRARRVRLPVLQQQEIVADGTFSFAARSGVPRTRGQCPLPEERPDGICNRVRCRYHLLLETAEHRAGRPGLASVKRDEKGHTISQPGDAGDERPGTTLRPGWFKVRGLQVEREVKVYVTRVDGGYEISEVRAGTLDYWLTYLRMGEDVTVWEGSVHSSSDGPGIGRFLARARREPTGIAFDRELPDSVLQSSDCLVFVRTRAVASCALDEIDRVGRAMTNQETGDAYARHRTLSARDVKSALGHAVEVADEMGMTKEELMRGLRELGAGS